jgi:hypothetical protein
MQKSKNRILSLALALMMFSSAAAMLFATDSEAAYGRGCQGNGGGYAAGAGGNANCPNYNTDYCPYYDANGNLVNPQAAATTNTVRATKAAKTAASKISYTSKRTIRRVQTALKKAGYKPGTLRGVMVKRTKTALKKFQRANNLKATGKINQNTCRLLGIR